MSLILDGTACDIPASLETISSDPKFAFLASFEEITDYQVVDGKIQLNSVSQNETKTSKKKKKKRANKQTNVVPDSTATEICGDTSIKTADETSSKNNKKKKKKGKKRKVSEKVQLDAEWADAKRLKSSDDNSVEDTPNISQLDLPQQSPEIPENNESSETDSGTMQGMDSWSGLFVHEEIQRALLDRGFTEPTPIQRLVLPSAIRDRLDILGAAETGSGKTLAFSIPIISGLIKEENKLPGVKAVIMTPTRELAIQVKDHINAMLKYVDLKVCCVIGGMSIEKQMRLVKKGNDIIVATPGRLWQLLQDTDCIDLCNLKFLTIDETDRMVEQGHFEELNKILEMINGSSGQRQCFVFSATLTYVHPAPKRLGKDSKRELTPKEKLDSIIEATGMRKEKKIIDLTRQFGTAETLTECRINADSLQEKDTYLYYFLTVYPGRTLVFTNSIDSCRRLHSVLSTLKLQPYLLHAKMQQRQRLKNLERFTASNSGILLATDVAARGLDIPGIQHVVHYHVPRTAEIYVHRSGRTARANREGVSVMLVDMQDKHFYERICRNLNRDEDLPSFPVNNKNLLNELKKVLEVGVSIESLQHQTKKSRAKSNWFVKAASDADIIMDQSLIPEETVLEDESKEIQVRKLKSELDRLLSEIGGRQYSNFDVKKTRYPTFEIVEQFSKERTSALHQAKSDNEKKKRKKAKKIVKLA